MSYNLSKGETVSLNKPGKTLTKARIGLGWDVAETGAAFDLDTSIVCLDANGQVVPGGFVFFGNLTSFGGAIKHNGDNLTGDGDGDDETIDIDFPGLPAEVMTLVLNDAIYEASKRGDQTFAQVNNAYSRVVDLDDNSELARYTLTEKTPDGTNVVEMGRFQRTADGWTYTATGATYSDEIGGIASRFGIAISN